MAAWARAGPVRPGPALCEQLDLLEDETLRQLVRSQPIPGPSEQPGPGPGRGVTPARGRALSLGLAAVSAASVVSDSSQWPGGADRPSAHRPHRIDPGRPSRSWFKLFRAFRPACRHRSKSARAGSEKLHLDCASSAPSNHGSTQQWPLLHSRKDYLQGFLRAAGPGAAAAAARADSDRCRHAGRNNHDACNYSVDSDRDSDIK
jgi:hypothetical protein